MLAYCLWHVNKLCCRKYADHLLAITKLTSALIDSFITSAHRSINPSSWKSVAVARVEIISRGSSETSSKYSEPKTVNRAGRGDTDSNMLALANEYQLRFFLHSFVIRGSTTSMSIKSLWVSRQDPPNMQAK